ncbi:MAG: hypothetical protein WD468_12080 [Pirellulales bacterium]
MIVPRFTIRTALIGVTICAMVFVIVGMAVRGESWAWGITIGIISLVVTMFVHAAWFGLVSMFARVPAAQPVPVATTIGRPSEPTVDHSEDRVEAKP